MNIIYVAEDGTKFNSKTDCLNYEEKLNIQNFSDTALLYDRDGYKLPLTHKGFSDAIYIVAKTDAAALFMDDFFGNWDTPWTNGGMCKAGCWVFYIDKWRCADEILQIADTIKQIY